MRVWYAADVGGDHANLRRSAVVVNPGGAVDPRPTVLRLPPPEGVLRNRMLARRAKGV